MQRTIFEATIDKFNAMKEAENNGIVADSLEVRKALMQKVYAGEITLVDAQARLKKIKAQAKKNGQITRAQAFSRG